MASTTRQRTYYFASPRPLLVQNKVSFTEQEGRPLLVQNKVSFTEQEESTIEYKKPAANLEKEIKVVFDMLKGFSPRREGRKPPTTYSPMKEETPIDSNQAALAYGGVVLTSYATPNRSK